MGYQLDGLQTHLVVVCFGPGFAQASLTPQIDQKDCTCERQGVAELGRDAETLVGCSKLIRKATGKTLAVRRHAMPIKP